MLGGRSRSELGAADVALDTPAQDVRWGMADRELDEHARAYTELGNSGPQGQPVRRVDQTRRIPHQATPEQKR